MKKTKTTLLVSLLFLGLFFVFAQGASAEVINSFSSTINVLPDSSVLIKEKINYDFETAIRHGIYRTIPLTNSQNKPMKIRVISVLDSNDEAYNFTSSIKNDILTIQIGDKDRMISGLKDYVIYYQVWGSISYFENFDEMYWNVTGNDWDVSIKKIEASVVLPKGVFSTKKSCYYGEKGSADVCIMSEPNIFTTEESLGEGEGLTVAVGFPKGAVSVYQPEEKSDSFKIFKTFWPIIIPAVFFVFMFRRWKKKGKDPKGTGVIIPQYDVPENLTPLEVGGIVNEGIRNQNISAEIIYLAVKGYLKIRKIDKDKEDFLGLTSKDDYEFTLLKQIGFLENNFDKKILTSIFGESGMVGGVARLSELKNIFYENISHINSEVVDNLLEKKYYTNLPKSRMIGAVVVIFAFFVLAFLSNFMIALVGGIGGILGLIVLFVSAIAFLVTGFVFNYLMPAKSPKGVYLKEYLLGLKEYLQIAEKDRLAFHNAPEKKPEIFEALLPYAMIFGVEKLWAKEFEGIYVQPPKWFDEKGSSFNVVTFGSEIAMFNALTTTSLSSTPNSSAGGSGGGGFSGGGGGGGGGGSW